MGDRVGLIEQALALMNREGMRVLSVSRLYETKAMYYENQDSFINGACCVGDHYFTVEVILTLAR